MDSFRIFQDCRRCAAALLLIVGFRTYIHSQHPHYDPAHGYQLPAPPPEEDGADGKGRRVAPEFNPADVVAKLAEAKPDAGKKAFGVCLGCHTADASAASKAGPEPMERRQSQAWRTRRFQGLFRPDEGQGRRMDLRASRRVSCTSPKAYLPGTKMGFAGVKQAARTG